MQPYIEFNRDKIKARFGSLPKFAAYYGITYGVVRYRIDNPYYNRMFLADHTFRIFKQMEKDGYLKIVDRYYS
ncbi:hypothetical protein [Helicobacter suis]|uniref:hypothetical protein n=1 Tax=Helicobacter suis TaxID=104628 RepID=UPI0013D68BB7|nr:hypothetical protein [Helicobacter suis]